MLHENQKKQQKLIYSPLMVFVFASLLVLISISLISMIKKQHESEKKKQAMIQEEAKLKVYYSSLEGEIADLNTDYGVERTLREKFGVVKPGDGAIVIVDEKVDIEKKESRIRLFFKRLFGKNED